MVSTIEDGFYHAWEIAALAPRLIDADEEGGKAGEIHQEIVDEIFDAPTVMSAEDAAEGKAVGAAEGMIADEGVALAIGVRGKILHAFDMDGDIEETEAIVYPRYALLLAFHEDEAVEPILVHDAFEIGDEEAGDIFRPAAHLCLEDAVNIYEEWLWHKKGS